MLQAINSTQLDNHTRFFGNLCNADDKLEEIKYYHSELELLIKREKDKLAGIDVNFESNPDLYNKKFHFEHTLSNNLRASIIISLVTFLEIELQNFCSDLQIACSLEVKYNDFKGTIVEQFKIYTNKIALLQINLGSTLYQTIKEVIELRNCIVHYEGQIENFYGRKFNRSESIQNITKKFPSIKIEDNDFITLDANACIECISIVEKFIDMIYNCVLEKFPNKITAANKSIPISGADTAQHQQ